MKFKRYQSIEGSHRHKFINNIIEAGLNHPDVLWVASNKVHGANHAYYCDGDEVISAKRSGFLGGDGDKFFNAGIVLEKYRNSIRNATVYLAARESYDAPINHVVFCGELFGGEYPHKDVERSSCMTTKRVQKGVYYTPENEFYLFDIKIVFEDGTSSFLSDTMMNKIGMMFGFITGEEFKVYGTFDEIMALSNDFEDPFHKLFDLPSLGKENVSEGWVKKPVIAQTVRNSHRVILKDKNPKFQENASKRKAPQQPFEYSQTGRDLLDCVMGYISENRLRNVLSHGDLENITNKDFGKIMSFFTHDIIDDFLKDYKREVNLIEKSEWKQITKTISRESANLIRANLVNIIDGEF